MFTTYNAIECNTIQNIKGAMQWRITVTLQQ